MYFEQFPIIYYDFDIDGERVVKLIRDVTLNVRLRKQMIENIAFYDDYVIKDGETPEILSARIYGSPSYHWIIMLANLKFDIINDWPLSERQFNNYIAELYPEMSDRYAVHHYEDENGLTVNQDYVGATPISNFDVEYNKNEEKRNIKLISPTYLGQILNDLKGLI